MVNPIAFLKTKVWQVDGIQVTVGLLLVIAVIAWLYLRSRR